MKKRLLSFVSVTLLSMVISIGASAQLWILGEVDGNGDTWAPNIGTQMTASTDNPGVYTATVTLSGKNDGFNYFSFTEKLAESASDWGSIASSRWGADSNNFPADSHLGEPMTLKKGENAFKLSAGVYDLLVNLNEGTLTVTRGEGGPEKLYVIGQIEESTSFAWDKGVEMTYSNGIYSATFTVNGDTNAGGAVEFSTSLGGYGTGTAYGYGGLDETYIGFPDGGDYAFGDEVSMRVGGAPFQIYPGKVKATVDLANLKVVFEQVSTDLPTSLYILGEANENTWAPNVGVEMTAGEPGKFTATITTDGRNDGYNYFSFTSKLAENADDWDAIAGSRYGADASDKEVVLGEAMALQAGENAFKIGAGNFTLDVDLAAGTLTVTGDTPTPPEPGEDKVYVLGTVNGGHGWSPDLGTELTKEGEGIYSGKLRIENVSDGYGFFGFSTKIATDPTDWDGIAPYRFGAVGEGDYTIADEIGTYELTKTDYQAFRAHSGEWKFTVNTTAMTLQMEPINLDPEQTPAVYILGDVNGQGWAPNVGTAMEFDGLNYIATVDIDNTSEGYGCISFTTQLAETADDWDAIAGFRFGAEPGEGENFLVTDELLDNPIALSKTDFRAFQIAAGNYIISVSADRTSVVFSKGAPEPISSFYILGNIDNEGWAPNRGLEMTTVDGVTFTAENVNFTPEYESEFSYFSFTSKLAENSDDWDAISSARYCADGTDDVLIDESNMFTNVSIVPFSVSQKAFKIHPGFYNVTVNTQMLWVNITPGAGVDSVDADRKVVSTEYVNALGVVASRPFDGLNIVVDRMSDGSTRTSKRVIIVR